MTDNRFPSPGVDARFPSPGTDVRFPSPGVDEEHKSTGEDTRFEGASYGGSGPDITAPTIVSTSPADNAVGVLATVSPTITFSEPVAFGTGLITLREFNGSWADLETFDVTTDVGTGDGQVSISGAVLTINPTGSLTASREYAIRIAATAIDDLAANSFAGVANDTTISFTVAAAGVDRDPEQFRWNIATDHGSTGDVFVDADTGSDANPGTELSPKATIAGGLAILSAGETLLARGTFREIVDLTGKGGTGVGSETVIQGWGTDKPIITAQDQLTGWVACTIADEAALSAAIWPNCYRVDVPLADFVGSDPGAAWLHEDGVPMPHAAARLNPRDRIYQQETNEYLTSDVTVTSGGLITGYRLASLTSTLTTAQIENCEVLFHADPNIDYRTPVLNYDTGTSTIELTDQTQTYETNIKKDRFALVNCLPKMREGEWGYTVSGATVTLYVWPNDVLNLTSNMSYAARARCIQMGADNHIKIIGVICEGAASSGASTNNNYAITKTTATDASNFTLRNALVRNTYRASRDYAPIRLRNLNDYTVEGVRVETCPGQFGIFFSAGDNGVVRFVDVVGAENSPFRFYGQKQLVFSNCRGRRSGLTSHANKFNFYEQCHEVLAHNIDVDSVRGYATWQEASRVHFVNVIAPASTDGRGIVDQNNATDTPAVALAVTGTSSILNCWNWPYATNLDPGQASMSLTAPNNTEVTFSVYNTIAHGLFVDEPTEMDDVSHCVWTRNAAFGAGIEQVVTNETDNYEDPAAGDFRVKAGAPIRTAVTKDLTTEIAALQAMFPLMPTADWDYDMVGNEIDWSAPPMGPLVDIDATRDMAPVWMEKPILGGTPVVGNTATCDDGIWASSPYRSISKEWFVDGVSVGTGDSYTWVVGDIGGVTSCVVTATNSAGSDSVTVEFDDVVAAGFPISNPVLITPALVVSNSVLAPRNIETATFTANNKPLLVVFTYVTANAPSTTTVTVGTPGRSFGTGTAIPEATGGSIFRRTTRSGAYHGIVAPGSGSVTVQCQASIDVSSYQVHVFEIDGATGFNGAGTPAGSSSGTSVSPSYTTTANESLVIHAVVKQTDTDPISVSGASVLAEVGSSLATLRTAIAFEQVPTSGTAASATFSWTTAVTHESESIEVLS